MRGNFGLFRTFSPKLPRIHVDFIVMQMRKINREKGYWRYIEMSLLLFCGSWNQYDGYAISSLVPRVSHLVVPLAETVALAHGVQIYETSSYIN